VKYDIATGVLFNTIGIALMIHQFKNNNILVAALFALLKAGRGGDYKGE